MPLARRAVGITSLSELIIDTHKDWGGYRIQNLGAPLADAHVARRADLRPVATRLVAAVDSVDKTRADYICDGVADQEEINAAIAELPAAGGEIHLLDGNYTIDSVIELPSNVMLSGCGYSTRIFMSAGMTTPGIRASTKDGVVVTRLRVDGNRVNQTADVPPIDIVSCTRSIVRECWVFNGRNSGISIAGSSHTRVQGC